ncbi:hypothetical protein JOE58_000669 [Curtobacterium luteum]|uniref:Uncharacterized protein n=1 Tax=Curtobacterium luteum TaxID=33881 RepID=A0ABS2RR09_9MICO|nr:MULTISPECIES: hypothetical protein [Curtobacterium]MBM7801418.1 hypothetical protein [Curtobacterium luteum]NUU49912.1 hypothetical protein [Curtobacterium luteum]
MTRSDEVVGVVGPDAPGPLQQTEDAADLRAHRAALAEDDGSRVPFEDLRAEV